MMFDLNEIWAYPTDTSFGLGVRADDEKGLQKLFELKGRGSGQYFSLMCADFEMLKRFAKVPENIDKHFFFEKPRTAILSPTSKCPKSLFWPEQKVAFRISTIPEVIESIKNQKIPITATSANFSGESAIFSIKTLREKFGDQIFICDKIPELPEREASEIWDFTGEDAKRIR